MVGPVFAESLLRDVTNDPGALDQPWRTGRFELLVDASRTADSSTVVGMSAVTGFALVDFYRVAYRACS